MRTITTTVGLLILMLVAACGTESGRQDDLGTLEQGVRQCRVMMLCAPGYEFNAKSCRCRKAPKPKGGASCATVRCMAGTYCTEYSGTAQCLPYDTCATVDWTCEKGYECQDTPIQCFAAPCAPTAPTCVQTAPTCWVIDCARPPAGCNYTNPTYDANGCMTSCGTLSCTDPLL